MPCGVNGYQESASNANATLHLGETEDGDKFDTIYILDDNFLSNQIDLIDYFDDLSNCVVMKSTHENITSTRVAGSTMTGNIKWNMIQEILDNRDYRHFFYFHNENHEDTYFNEHEIDTILYGKSKDIKNKLKCFKVLMYYTKLLTTKVKLLLFLSILNFPKFSNCQQVMKMVLKLYF